MCPTRRSALLGLMLVAGVAISGCGNNGTTRADLVTAANKICVTSNATFKELFATLFAKGDEEPAPEVAAPVLVMAARAADKEAAAFSQLDAPKADRTALADLRGAFAVFAKCAARS